MFKPRDTNRAKDRRNNATTPERLLWQQIRSSKLGHKFSRQMPIGPYFADFLCRELKLVIEIDGASHDQNVEYDARREAYIRALGFEILRFSNVDVMSNLEGAVYQIRTTLENRPTPGPSRKREGGN